MSLQVTTPKVEPDIVVLHPSRSITRGPQADAIESHLNDLLRRGERKLIFDLADLDRIGPDPVLFIARSIIAVRQCGGELRFAAVEAQVPRLFKRNCAPTEYEELASDQQAGTRPPSRRRRLEISSNREFHPGLEIADGKTGLESLSIVAGA
jgi:hypothetical protein